MIEGNQYCICSHKKDFHIGNRGICRICSLLNVEGWWSHEILHCGGFKLDNLKYLEDLYEAIHK
jgi:hypothetical protein